LVLLSIFLNLHNLKIGKIKNEEFVTRLIFKLCGVNFLGVIGCGVLVISGNILLTPGYNVITRQANPMGKLYMKKIAPFSIKGLH